MYIKLYTYIKYIYTYAYTYMHKVIYDLTYFNDYL